jgi:shikimate dehydrogenase
MSPITVSGTTRLVGILGYPIEHSLSPAMHNAAFSKLGLDYFYLPLSVTPQNLEEAVRGMWALGFAGANVTIPHKEAMIGLVSELSPEAQAIGAVNTLSQGEAGWVGHNTDVVGFLEALLEGGLSPRDKVAVVLGAGGAARAATYALASVGAKVVVLNRRLERAERLVAELASSLPDADLASGSLDADSLSEALSEAHLLVNATPLGMFPHTDTSPIPQDVRLPSHLTCFDMVYNPTGTRFLWEGRTAGARGMGGLKMLVHQGAEAFRLWTGKTAPVSLMYDVCQRHLKAGMGRERV